MSSALAIASVSAVLKNLLDNALLQQASTMSMGEIAVSTLPPDRIPVGTDERAQLNLYLYRLTPNSSRRSASMLNFQEQLPDNPPLALDLHYLLTVYGERDFQAEMLLGLAVQFFHENPILTQKTIRSALASISSGGNPLLETFSTSTLADQVQQIKISPEFLNMEETVKLWSSLQARSRLSMTYLVSMVFIEDRRINTAVQDTVSKVMIS